MYYKIIHDEEILLADKLDTIREQANGAVVRCNPEHANGVTLNGENYHVDGMPAFPTADYDTVTVEEVTRAEYLALADDLGVEVEPSVEDVPILREQLAEQTERNDMIEECLLEMSEIIYA